LPKISIIVPVRNAQDHLEESLDSALEQTLQDIEVICVDDASQDATAGMLSAYALRDQRVRVITYAERRTASQARKDGVLAATGEYVMFLDADDALEPHACEWLYAAATDSPVDILHFGTAVTVEADLPQATVDWVLDFVRPYEGELEGDAILEGSFSANRLYNFSLWDKLYSAALCKKAFARVQDGSFPRGQDKYAYFLLSYFAQTYRGVPEKVLYHYRLGRGGTGHDLLTLSRFEEYCALGRVADAMRAFLVEEGALDRHAAAYANARTDLVRDCVDNWARRLDSNDKTAGFRLMQEYWQDSEVLAAIAWVVTPRVSLVAPVEATPERLRAYLDSAVAQTMPDIEVICIEHPDPDASSELLREYAARDPRVRVIPASQNRSVSTARKDGVRAARGEYLLLLDPDDELPLDACERLYATTPSDLVRNFVMPYEGALEGDAVLAYVGLGETEHNLISLPQFEKHCMLALMADGIRDTLIASDELEAHAELYDQLRIELLRECVGRWNDHLAAEDKAAGFDLMLAYWHPHEVVGVIAKLNWSEQGHVARLLKESTRLARSPRTTRVIGTYYHRYENGGAERVLSILIQMWLDLGYKVVLFTDDPPSPNDYDLPRGVHRVVLPSFFEVDSDSYVYRARELEWAIQEQGIDVMVYHAWVSKMLLWDLLVCKAAGVSFVTHCHNVFSHLARAAWPYFADMPAVYHLSDTVVALSEVDRAYWSNFSDDVVPVVNPFTFDLNEMEIAPLRDKAVLWLGRISPEKRPHDALRIFAKILEAEPTARLIMVGSSDDESYMLSVHDLIDELGIRDSVSLHGFSRDVLPFYQAASVFLMTSEYEGFSLVLAESQSAGVPCVMYDLPYLTLTQARKGFIAVEMGDLNAAADAVVDLLADPQRRLDLGREARVHIEELAGFDFSGTWRAIFDGLEQVPAASPLDDATRIMWETLMGHYRGGVKQRDREWKQRAGEIKAARRTLKKLRQTETKLRASWSFRIGYAITSVPRKIRATLGHQKSGSDARI